MGYVLIIWMSLILRPINDDLLNTNKVVSDARGIKRYSFQKVEEYVYDIEAMIKRQKGLKYNMTWEYEMFRNF